MMHGDSRVMGGGVFGDNQFTSTLSVKFPTSQIPRRTKKPSRLTGYFENLVGVRGFEPRPPHPMQMRLPGCATPTESARLTGGHRMIWRAQLLFIREMPTASLLFSQDATWAGGVLA